MHGTSARERTANPLIPNRNIQGSSVARYASGALFAAGEAPATAVAEASSRPVPPASGADADASAGSAPAKARSKLGPHLALLTRMVEERPRAMIMDFHLVLKERGYSGSYDLVKKKVQSLRRALGRQAGAQFASAEAPCAQVELARIPIHGPNGMAKAHLFTMTLGLSGRCYAELLPGCDLGSFLRCHRRAFEAFGGVPAGLFYDTQGNPDLRRLAGGFPFHLPIADCARHYGYAAHPTPAFAPWMKGRLKRPAKILRKLFFSGRAFASLERANADMQAWLAGRDAAEEQGGNPKGERLRPLPDTGFDPEERRQFLRLRA